MSYIKYFLSIIIYLPLFYVSAFIVLKFPFYLNRLAEMYSLAYATLTAVVFLLSLKMFLVGIQVLLDYLINSKSGKSGEYLKSYSCFGVWLFISLLVCLFNIDVLSFESVFLIYIPILWTFSNFLPMEGKGN
jgi:hypothetical protein